MLSTDQRSGFVRFDRSELELSIDQRFENAVAAGPRRVAIKSDGGGMTYDALNRAANSVALGIVNLRGHDGEAVGLLCEGGDLAIAAVLGVLKAGKFYVPLDPSYPPERLVFVLQDCQPGILIVDSKHASLARRLAPSACAVTYVDDLIGGDGSENPGLPLSPDALAAVFYTSGSTGRPKGVMQSHRTVLHRVMLNTNMFRIGPQDRLSLLTSPSYSASMRHLFCALLNGAAICPFNVAEKGLIALADWLSRERITVYSSVPAVFRQFMGIVSGTADFGSLRIVELFGDCVTDSDFELYKKQLPASCIFANLLASNEAGVLRVFIADKATQLSDATVPVGYEVEDKEILIIDDVGRPLCHSEVGEITVRSAFLSPGYWGQPNLTAAAFRPDPTDALKRVYYSGDLGTLLPDGRLMYKGRKDPGAKIHGIRVEVEAIEAALRSHGSVAQAAVAARQNQSGQDQLVAYVVPRMVASITARELRAFLAGRLADHMIPSRFMFMESLPLSPHGNSSERLPAGLATVRDDSFGR